jgi:hypothetical protein
MWYNIVQLDRPKMTVGRIHFTYMLDTSVYSHTLRVCNNYCFSCQQWLTRTRCNITLNAQYSAICPVSSQISLPVEYLKKQRAVKCAPSVPVRSETRNVSSCLPVQQLSAAAIQISTAAHCHSTVPAKHLPSGHTCTYICGYFLTDIFSRLPVWRSHDVRLKIRG